jgi:hypothetical protein
LVIIAQWDTVVIYYKFQVFRHSACKLYAILTNPVVLGRVPKTVFIRIPIPIEVRRSINPFLNNLENLKQKQIILSNSKEEKQMQDPNKRCHTIGVPTVSFTGGLLQILRSLQISNLSI